MGESSHREGFSEPVQVDKRLVVSKSREIQRSVAEMEQVKVDEEKSQKRDRAEFEDESTSRTSPSLSFHSNNKLTMSPDR